MRLFEREVFSAVIASAFAGMLLTIFMAYLGVYLDRLGAIAIIVGLVFFARNFFQIFLRVPFAELSQILGRKPLITAGTAFYTVAFFLMYLANHWLMIFFATVMIAVGMSCYWPAMFAFIGDVSTDDYGRINGYIFQGSDVGVILGTLLTTYLLDNGFIVLRELFLVIGLTGLVGVVVVYVTLEEVISEEDRVDDPEVFQAVVTSFKDSINSLIKMTNISPLGLIYVFQFIISFTEFFFSSFFPLLVVIALGFTDADVSRIILISTIVVFFFKPFLGSISDKFGFKKPVYASLIINTLIIFSLTYTTNYWVIVVLYSLLIASSLTSYLAVNGATSYSADSKLRGLAMGALGFYVSFGRTFSSLVLTPIWQYLETTSGNRGLSLIYLFRITAIIILFSIIAIAPFAKKLSINPE